MAKKTINLGTGELTGDGESIRSAFDKINDNFDELYTQDTNDVVLSSINASLIPDTDVAYDLGSASKRFRDIYLSGSTIDLGGLEISNVGGELQLGGVKVITQSELDVAVQNDITTNLTGSVFADDSTLLVDGVNSKINLQNTVLNNTISTTDEALYLNTSSIPGERGFKVSTTDSIFDIYGATLPDGNGGGLWLSGGIAEAGKRQGDVIISGRIVSILAGDGEGAGGISFAGPVIGTTAMDIKGSVFGDDSTLLVDGVNGRIVGPVENTAITTNTITGSSNLTLVGANGDTDGGTVVVVGGIGNGGDGGDITLAAGIGTAGIGGEVTIAGGIGSTNGGEVTITGGIGSAGEGGPVSISGGSGGTDGGDVTIYAGVGGTGNGVINIGTFNTSAVNIDNAVITGDLTGSVFADDSTVMVDAVNNTLHADTVNAVGFQGAFFGNGGLNSPLQLSSGLEGQTGNTIFINPQGSDTLVQMWGETINLVTGPFNTYDSPYMQFKTEGAFKAYQGAYFEGNLTGNLDGDVTGSVFADDSTTVVDGTNGNVTANILTSITASNFNGTLSVVGVTRLYDDLIISGSDIVSDNSAYFFGNLECSNITNLQNNEFASDDLTLSAEGNIILNSTVKTDVITNINGTLNINGNVDFGNAGTIDFTGTTVTGFPTANNAGVAYQYGYSAHDAVSTAGNDFSVNSTTMSVSLTATNLAQGARIDISGITSNTSAGTGLIYVQRRVNTGSWTVWNAFVVSGGGDHVSHSFVDFYDTGGTTFDVSAGDTVEYKLTNGTDNSSYNGNSSGAVDFELFFGFQFTATEIPVSYSLTQP